MKTALLKTHPGFGVISLDLGIRDSRKRAMVECYLRHRRDRKVASPNAAYWLDRARFHASTIA